MGNSEIHFGGSKQKRADNTIHLQQMPLGLMRQTTVPNAGTVPHRRDVHTPSFMNIDRDPSHMLSIMEKPYKYLMVILYSTMLS